MLGIHPLDQPARYASSIPSAHKRQATRSPLDVQRPSKAKLSHQTTISGESARNNRFTNVTISYVRHFEPGKRYLESKFKRGDIIFHRKGENSFPANMATLNSELAMQNKNSLKDVYNYVINNWNCDGVALSIDGDGIQSALAVAVQGPAHVYEYVPSLFANLTNNAGLHLASGSIQHIKTVKNIQLLDTVFVVASPFGPVLETGKRVYRLSLLRFNKISSILPAQTIKLFEIGKVLDDNAGSVKPTFDTAGSKLRVLNVKPRSYYFVYTNEQWASIE
jgi:hypothetical protein